MAKPKKDKQEEVKDEPGADERFGRILKRVLNTPPKKDAEQSKRRKARSRSRSD